MRHAPAIPLDELQSHLLNNLICLFYGSTQGSLPRARLFGACDTVRKLFAQATAGDVFPDTDVKAGSRVLSVQLGGLPGKKMVVAEGDTQDFEAMLDAVSKIGWFTKTEGKIIGSGTVEVRAMV